MPQQNSMFVCSLLHQPCASLVCLFVCRAPTPTPPGPSTSSLDFIRALLCWCVIQQSGYYRLQLSQHAHAKPTLAQALATTAPLSGLPAQVARRLYVAQSTPRPHTWASEREEAAWKVAFQSYFIFVFIGEEGNQVVTQYEYIQSPWVLTSFRSTLGRVQFQWLLDNHSLSIPQPNSLFSIM